MRQKEYPLALKKIVLSLSLDYNSESKAVKTKDLKVD